MLIDECNNNGGNHISIIMPPKPFHLIQVLLIQSIQYLYIFMYKITILTLLSILEAIIIFINNYI